MTEDEKLSPEAESVPKGTPLKAKEKREKGRLLTKIVCRRLPPTMNEEEFMKQVSPIPEHDYFYFSKPDLSLTPDLFSRAYINFINVEDIFLFRDKFDDYIFLDEKGNEYPAIVEYAPFQRLPKKRRKKDSKSGSIENDSTYLEFLESLKETDSDSREPKMEYSYQPTEEKKETSTPLLEFLAAKRRDEKKRREDRQKRRPKNRKEDEIMEEEIKKIKPRENDKDKPYNKKKDDDVSPKHESSNVESKDSKYVKGGSKGYRDQRRSDDQRKKGEYEKKDYSKGKDQESPGADDKTSRKDRKDRQREHHKEKFKEVKKYSESRRDKIKFADKKTDKLPSFRQIDDAEQDELINSSLDVKSNKSTSLVTESIPDKARSVSKVSLLSSNIKPFTQLPQYTPEDLTKVIEELDKSVKKGENKTSEMPSFSDVKEIKSTEQITTKKVIQPINKVSIEESSSKTSDVQPDKSNVQESTIAVLKMEALKKANDNVESLSSTNSNETLQQHQRRSSLESSEKKPSSDEAPLRRHKSLDDKSQDACDDSAKSERHNKTKLEHKSERRIRNKDRPSIAIYQPGMGRFSKQRIEREKDSPAGTYKAIDPNIGSSKDKLTEE